MTESVSTAALAAIKPSPSINEAMINRFYLEDGASRLPDPSLDAMATVLRDARTTCDSVVGLRDALAKDPTVTPASKALTLRDRASQAMQPVLTRSDRVRGEIVAEIAATRAKLDEIPTPGTQVEAQLEGEVRAALARLPKEERSKALAESLETDWKVLAAALRGPAMLSGLGPQEQEGWRRRWREARDPVALERLGRLEGALSAYDLSMDQVVAFTGATANVKGVQEALEAQALTARALAAVGGD